MCSFDFSRAHRENPETNTVNRRSTKYRLTLELGDVDLAFVYAPATDKGRQERLQVIGMLPRPLAHAEAQACYQYVWNHYFKVRFGKPGQPLTDAEADQRLKQEIKNYWVENGAIPPKGQYAKMRVPGDFPVLHRDFDDKFFDEPEFTLAKGVRFDMEQRYYDDNPALGRIPLVAKVEMMGRGDANWKPVNGIDVFFELKQPGKLPRYKSSLVGGEANTKVVAGASSYFNQVCGAPLRDNQHRVIDKAPELKRHQGGPNGYLARHAYLRHRTDKNFPLFDKKDPQANNVAFELGGKRALNPQGQITGQASTAKGWKQEDVFTGQAVGTHAPPSALLGKELKDHPYGVKAQTDQHGEAAVFFAPSRIGGDRYKILVSCKPHRSTKKVLTGTMVRWRTIRISKDVRVEAPKTAADLDPHLKTEFVTHGGSCEHGESKGGRFCGPCLLREGQIPDAEMKTYWTQELSKAYCELLLDPDAAEIRPAHELLTKDMFDTAIQEFIDDQKNSKQQSALSRCREVIAIGDGRQTQFQGQLKARGSIIPGRVLVIIRDVLAGDDGKGVIRQRSTTIVKGTVDYQSGAVTLTFAQPPTDGAVIEIGCLVRLGIDYKSLVYYSKKSPFLINLHSPQAYNSIIDSNKFPLLSSRCPVEEKVVAITDGTTAPITVKLGTSILPGTLKIKVKKAEWHDSGGQFSGQNDLEALGKINCVTGEFMVRFGKVTAHEVKLDHRQHGTSIQVQLPDVPLATPGRDRLLVSSVSQNALLDDGLIYAKDFYPFDQITAIERYKPGVRFDLVVGSGPGRKIKMIENSGVENLKATMETICEKAKIAKPEGAEIEPPASDSKKDTLSETKTGVLYLLADGSIRSISGFLTGGTVSVDFTAKTVRLNYTKLPRDLTKLVFFYDKEIALDAGTNLMATYDVEQTYDNAHPMAKSMPPARPDENVYAQVAGRHGAINYYLLVRLIRAVGQNKGFLPGLILMRAPLRDTWSAIWESRARHEGKGVCHGFFVFFGNYWRASGYDADLEEVDKPEPQVGRYPPLLLHEMGHCLYFNHFPTGNPNGVRCEQHDMWDSCLMGYGDHRGDHCGQCVASLMGINTGDKRLWTWKGAFNSAQTENSDTFVQPPEVADLTHPTDTDQVISLVMQCPEGRRVYDAAKKANGGVDPTIKYEAQGGGFVDLKAGEVGCGGRYGPSAAAQQLIMELGNLSRKEDFNQLDERMYAGEVGREEYTRGTEKIEYEHGVKSAIKSHDCCKQRWGNPKCYKERDRQWVVPDDWNGYFANIDETHKNNYRTDWDQKGALAYYRKHVGVLASADEARIEGIQKLMDEWQKKYNIYQIDAEDWSEQDQAGYRILNLLAELDPDFDTEEEGVVLYWAEQIMKKMPDGSTAMDKYRALKRNQPLFLPGGTS